MVSGYHLRTVIAAVTSAVSKHCKGCQQLAFELASLNNTNESRLTSECFEQTQQTKTGPGSDLWVGIRLVYIICTFDYSSTEINTQSRHRLKHDMSRKTWEVYQCVLQVPCTYHGPVLFEERVKAFVASCK